VAAIDFFRNVPLIQEQSLPVKMLSWLPGLLFAAFAFAPAVAGGQTITASLQTKLPGFSVSGTFDGITYQAWGSGLPGFETFEAFCVEPLESLVFFDPVVFQIRNLGTLGRSDEISRLIGGYLDSGQTDLDPAAVQWAIWEVFLETDQVWSLTAGIVLIDTVHPVTTVAANTPPGQPRDLQSRAIDLPGRAGRPGYRDLGCGAGTRGLWNAGALRVRSSPPPPLILRTACAWWQAGTAGLPMPRDSPTLPP
jgi:hypothetical protein